MGWLNLPHLPTLPLPVTAKHRVVKVQQMSRAERLLHSPHDPKWRSPNAWSVLSNVFWQFYYHKPQTWHRICCVASRCRPDRGVGSRYESGGHTHSTSFTRTTFGSLLSQIRVSFVCRLSSVTFVRPTTGVETFRNIFAILFLNHLLTSMQNFTEIVPGEPLRKLKRGSKIQRCHVRVSHLLVSFL